MYKPVLVHAKEQIDLMLCFDKKNDAEKTALLKYGTQQQQTQTKRNNLMNKQTK